MAKRHRGKAKLKMVHGASHSLGKRHKKGGRKRGHKRSKK